MDATAQPHRSTLPGLARRRLLPFSFVLDCPHLADVVVGGHWIFDDNGLLKRKEAVIMPKVWVCQPLASVGCFCQGLLVGDCFHSRRAVPVGIEQLAISTGCSQAPFRRWEERGQLWPVLVVATLDLLLKDVVGNLIWANRDEWTINNGTDGERPELSTTEWKIVPAGPASLT